MKPSRRFVTIAFLVVGASAVLTTLFAVGRAHALEQRATDIVKDMLASVRLLGQMQHEVDEQRLLFDAHILASDPADIARLDGEILRTQRELAATARAYDPWSMLPGERTAWERTRAQLDAVKNPLASVLDLSRQDKNAEARLAMQPVTAQFVTISAAFSDLIAINDTAAADSLAAIASLRRQLMLTLFGIGLATTLGALLVGRWAGREVASREADLLRYSRELEARNRDLDAFSGRVAHDIRGPLSVISLSAHQLIPRSPERSGAMNQLRRGIARIEALTSDLLALAGVGAQVPGTCDPATVATQVGEDLAARIDAEHGSLHISVSHAEVSCSGGLLRQALDNLAENAVKYRRQDVAPEVNITGTATNGGYTLRISDNGMGMSAEEAAQAFTPFYRSPRIQQQLPGSGLGLSIVRRVAEAAGGSVSVESQPGLGSTFVITLRLAHGTERRA